MSTVTVSATCTCGSLLPDLLLCSDHHRYWQSGQELTSVSKVIRQVWPIEKDFSRADPDILEHARTRGVLVDALFSQYINRERLRIPLGTPVDVIEEGKRGFNAVCDWWENGLRAKAIAQVVFSKEGIAGTADVCEGDDAIWDLKCVSKPDVSYALQLGGYVYLSGRAIRTCGLIHCKFTEGGAVATVKPIMYNAAECVDDWLSMLAFWRMVQRRGGWPKKEE